LSEPTTRILDLSDYWHMVRVRKWTVLTCAVLVATLAAGYVLLKPAQYRATATVQVNSIINPVTSNASGGTQNAAAPNMATEAQAVKSIGVADAVKASLPNLTLTPQQLSKRVTVGTVRDSTVMTIGYTAASPTQAAAVAEAFARAYLAQRGATVQRYISAAVVSLESEVKSYQKSLSDQQHLLNNTPNTTAQVPIRANINTLVKEIAAFKTQIADLTSTAAVATISVGSIVQDAVAPSAPIGPNLPLAIAIGLVLGAILGAGLTIVLGLRANRVGGRDELAIHLSAPVMAVIPKVEGWDKAEYAELVTREDPAAPASEAYRTLATNIRFYRSQQPLRVMVVTSALPSEGKSATAANLAVVLAETGLRTVLVDADLRRPRASRFIGVADHTGLHEALTGSRDLVDVIQATDIENLWIVGSGSVPRDPVSLLAGPNAASVFDSLRRVADVVICDAPPILPVADASVLAEASDAVLFVHDPAISNRTSLEDSVKQLRTAGGAIIGGVYNNISAAQRTYLGYASYDAYYGQDRKSRRAGRSLEAAAIDVSLASANGSGNGRAGKRRASRVSED
jgi:capsular exopolysaccharide synthesis family protein